MTYTSKTFSLLVRRHLLVVVLISMCQLAYAQSFRSKVGTICKKYPGKKNLYSRIVYIQDLYKEIDESVLYKKFQSNQKTLAHHSEAYYLHQIGMVQLLWLNGYIKESYILSEQLQWDPYIIQHKALHATVYNYTAELYHAVSNDYVNSKKFHLKALKINREIKDTTAIQSSCINAASMCFLLKQFKEGEQLLMEARRYLKAGYTTFEPYIVSSQLVSIMLQNKHDEALQFLQENEKQLTFVNKSTYHVNKGIVLYSLERFEASEAELLLSWQLSLKEKQTDVYHKSVKYLSFIYDRKKDVPNAYKFGKLRDSIEEINAGVQIKTTIDSLKLSNAKKHVALQTKLSKAQLKASQLKLKNLIVVLFISILALLVVSVLLFRIRRKNVALVRNGMQSTLHFDSKVIPLNTSYSAVSSENAKQEIKETILALALEIDEYVVKKHQFKNKEISLQYLAKKLKSNHHDVSEAINASYGLSLPNLLNKLRIHEAMKLLSDPNYKHYSIEGISREVGYESISTFNRNFKEITGVTPSFFQRESLKINLKKVSQEERA